MTPTPQLLHNASLIRDLDLHLIESLLRATDTAPTTDPVTQSILALTSRVTGDGHVCLDLAAPAWWQLQAAAPA